MWKSDDTNTTTSQAPDANLVWVENRENAEDECNADHDEDSNTSMK